MFGGAWAFQRDRVRTLWWTVVVGQGLSEAQGRALEACEELDWWGWLRLLEQGGEHACGYAWARADLARVARTPARQAWLVDGVQPGSRWSMASRFQGALALELAGVVPPQSPMWLALEPGLPAAPTAWVDDVLGEAPGGRIVALRTARELQQEDWTEASGRAVKVLAQGDGPAAAAARQAAMGWLGLADDELVALGRRRPPHELPAPWSDALGRYARCTQGCLPRLLDLVDTLSRDPTGLGQPASPTIPGATLPPALKGLVGSEAAADALAWLVARDAQWVAAGAAPDRRLARLVRRAGPVPTEATAQVWTGRLPPATSALVLLAVGEAAGVPVRVDEGLTVRLGPQEGASVGALCGPAGATGLPTGGDVVVGPEVPLATLRAWARSEQGPVSSADDPVGRRVGEALGRRAVPAHPCPVSGG